MMMDWLHKQIWLKDKPKIISWGAAALGVFFGQAFLLSQSQLALSYPDTPTYVYYAQTLLHGTSIGNYQRTVGYPLFLLPFIIGGEHYKAVVIVQILLALIGFVEIYGLVYNLTQSRIYPALTVILLSLDLEYIQFERTVLTEELSIFCAITFFYMLERYLALHKKKYVAAAMVTLGFMVVVRPAFIYLPVVIAAGIVMYHYFCAKIPRAWLTAILALLVPYGCLFWQITLNYLSPIHYFGLTNVSNINNFGKILKYHMELLTTDPKYTALKRAAAAYVASGKYQPVIFVEKYPQFADPSNSFVGAYTNEIISQHKWLYARNNIRDIISAFTTKPYLLGFAHKGLEPLLYTMTNISQLTVYTLFPVIILFYLVQLIMKRTLQHRDALMLVLAVAALGMVLIAAVGSFNSYDRLRIPFEWAVYSVVIYGLAAAAKQIAALCSRLLRRSAGYVRNMKIVYFSRTK